jgi:integrase
VDATGLAQGAVSTFFALRLHHHGQKPLPWRHWLKWVAADLGRQFLLSQIARRGPWNDYANLPGVVETASHETIQTFLLTKLREGYAWETVHHFRCALSKLLGSAEEWKYIADNPARQARLPRREYRPERPILTPAQIRSLIVALPEPAKSVAMLLALTGLRIGELLALRWKNVDLDARLLRVMETVYEGRFGTPKTRRSVRTIPIGPKVLSIFSNLHKGGGDPEHLVLSTCSGRPLCRRNLMHRQLQPTCEELGFPKVTWHVLRHCHATLLDSVGAPLGTVQSLLGHASSEITRQVYLHAIPAEQRRAVAAVERLAIGPKWTQVVGVAAGANFASD